MKIYPIKFNPILKEKVWGGNKLLSVLSKQTDKKNIGESWEISDIQENISEVSNGIYKGLNLKDLIINYKDEFLGTNNFEYFGSNFPLLVKFVDANKNLSVQVHPDNEMAKKYHDAFGKTEMWYIMESDAHANVILGLKDKNTNSEMFNHICSENVESVFNKIQVKKGDCFFVPAGEVHAIGAGVLAAEIQQTSDITYRIYDWNRKNYNGQKRKLHQNLAEKAVKRFKSKNQNIKISQECQKNPDLVKCEYFTTNLLEVNHTFVKNYANLDSFLIFMCVEGSVEVTVGNFTETINIGETVLFPAITNEIKFSSSNGKILETYIK